MDEELVGKKTVSLTTDVITLEASDEIRELYTFMRKAMYASVWEMSSDPITMMTWARNFSVAWKLTCDRIVFLFSETFLNFRHSSARNTIRNSPGEEFRCCYS